MKTAVIVFPGSNCDRDIATALEDVTGTKPQMVWHGETELPSGLDLIVLRLDRSTYQVRLAVVMGACPRSEYPRRQPGDGAGVVAG